MGGLLKKWLGGNPVASADPVILPDHHLLVALQASLKSNEFVLTSAHRIEDYARDVDARLQALATYLGVSIESVPPARAADTRYRITKGGIDDGTGIGVGGSDRVRALPSGDADPTRLG